MVVQVVLHRPLSSDLAHKKPVGARFRTGLQPFFKVKVIENIQSIPSPLERGPPDQVYRGYLKFRAHTTLGPYGSSMLGA